MWVLQYHTQGYISHVHMYTLPHLTVLHMGTRYIILWLFLILHMGMLSTCKFKEISTIQTRCHSAESFPIVCFTQWPQKPPYSKLRTPKSHPNIRQNQHKFPRQQTVSIYWYKSWIVLVISMHLQHFKVSLHSRSANFWALGIQQLGRVIILLCALCIRTPPFTGDTLAWSHSVYK